MVTFPRPTAVQGHSLTDQLHAAGFSGTEARSVTTHRCVNRRRSRAAGPTVVIDSHVRPRNTRPDTEGEFRKVVEEATTPRWSRSRPAILDIKGPRQAAANALWWNSS
jgi:hypothetical protein